MPPYTYTAPDMRTAECIQRPGARNTQQNALCLGSAEARIHESTGSALGPAAGWSGNLSGKTDGMVSERCNSSSVAEGDVSIGGAGMAGGETSRTGVGGCVGTKTRI